MPLVAVNPPTVTVMDPEVAPAGTAATNCVAEAEDTVAAVPLNFTELFVFVVLKFVPTIVTGVVTGPIPGENEVIVGGVVTVKLVPLVAVNPPTVTVMVPEVAPVGTGTTSVVAVAVETIAVVPLNLTMLFVVVVLKFVPVMVTGVVTGPVPGENEVIVGGVVTVKLVLLVAVNPPTVTVMVPDVAPVGTGTTRVVAVAVETVAVVPLNLTVLLVLVVLKFVPVMVSGVVTGPAPGENDVIDGGVVTVKLVLLVAVNPPTVTVMVPDVAPVGTGTTSVVAVAVDTVAVVPLNLTMLFVVVVLKFVPVIVTGVVTGPAPGENDVIVGGVVTVKLVLLVAVNPPTVTVMVPDVAPVGTGTTSVVAVAVETVAVVPLNLTVLLVLVVLKFVPVIVTAVVTGPAPGENEVMVGGVVTVKLVLLVAVNPPTVTVMVPDTDLAQRVREVGEW